MTDIKSLWKTNKTHISVRSLGEPFWRAGRKFGPDPIVVAKADLSDAQAAALIVEPALAINEVDDPNPPKVDPTKVAAK